LPVLIKKEVYTFFYIKLEQYLPQSDLLSNSMNRVVSGNLLTQDLLEVCALLHRGQECRASIAMSHTPLLSLDLRLTASRSSPIGGIKRSKLDILENGLGLCNARDGRQEVISRRDPIFSLCGILYTFTYRPHMH